LLVVYGGYFLLARPMPPLRTGPFADAWAGCLGGLTGGLAGFPGASVTIWCGLKGWDKARQRAVYQPFILAKQPLTLMAIHLMRPSSADAEYGHALCAPTGSRDRIRSRCGATRRSASARQHDDGIFSMLCPVFAACFAFPDRVRPIAERGLAGVRLWLAMMILSVLAAASCGIAVLWPAFTALADG
jgi:hypothetical protein